MSHFATIIERTHLTTIEWKKGILITGDSPRVKEFSSYLHGHFEFPKAVPQSSPSATSTFDLEDREVRNDFELVMASLKMGADLKVEVIITEEL